MLILISFNLSLLLQFLVSYICQSLQLCLDTSLKPQKLHKKTVPRVGGIPIFLSFLILIFYKIPHWLPSLIATFPVFLGGFLEDLTQKISYHWRFLFMLVGAYLFTLFFENFVITDLAFIKFSHLIGITFTIFALVGITNAFNIIDGINGLSSGIALIVFGTLLVLFWQGKAIQYIPPLEILIGSTLAFFILNFFFNKVFLGDSGSYTLGFLSGVFTIFAVKTLHASPWIAPNLMFYPIWETLFSIFRRLKKGKSPFYPDREHLHHLLYEFFGKNHIKTTGVILITHIINAFWILLFYKNTIILVITFIFFIIGYVILYNILRSKVLIDTKS